ncbi:MAG TPA: hypothetical protein PK055_08680 [Gammaproteobacteria bacterium]|nr:hypothetical protein [Gammaproteobacteria bacterium]HPQ87719.1 hypothetical protein [Gammaproteobacteria bacterium]
MKKIISICVLIYGSVSAKTPITVEASEPEKITTDGMIETVSREDVELDEDTKVNLQTELPDLELPLLEFDERTTNKSANANSQNSQTVEKKESTTATTNTPKIVIAEDVFTYKDLIRNDKVVISESGNQYVYRLANNVITQYKLDGNLNLKSSGLRKKDDKSYYVIDNKKLFSQNSEANSEEIADVVGLSKDILEKRRSVERSRNGGNKIETEIKLSDLKSDDEIYIFGDVLLVERIGGDPVVEEKFWLMGSPNFELKKYRKISNAKYKVR